MKRIVFTFLLAILACNSYIFAKENVEFGFRPGIYYDAGKIDGAAVTPGRHIEKGVICFKKGVPYITPSLGLSIRTFPNLYLDVKAGCSFSPTYIKSYEIDGVVENEKVHCGLAASFGISYTIF